YIISPNEKRVITPELITDIVAEHFDLTPGDIVGNKRNSKVVFPRQIVMYLCRHMTDTTLKNIGQYLGGRDQTQIMNGITIIESLPETGRYCTTQTKFQSRISTSDCHVSLQAYDGYHS